MGLLPSRPASRTTKQVGDAAEERALGFLQAKGLQFVGRNYRTPGRGGGEIDLIMRDHDGTLVFVEVRKRSRADHGGAAASVGHVKQRRIIFAARHYLLQLRTVPPCRFDVVVMDCDEVEWLRAAFDAS
ncbi:MAG: YraN family protein [Rhodoferax sp.]|uniref:YraN family protein n=1 Tax=Rhodoferax sp. TaxID=50421 RepID=UPI002ACD23C7|nr:YraN family protein [Rhodoferax sp.]MDZ7890331.1 YraN family protein [Rhodoferax sp.]